jgi:hypothetical protein
MSKRRLVICANSGPMISTGTGNARSLMKTKRFGNTGLADRRCRTLIERAFPSRTEPPYTFVDSSVSELSSFQIGSFGLKQSKQLT